MTLSIIINSTIPANLGGEMLLDVMLEVVEVEVVEVTWEVFVLES